jgi:hypothetical protein
MKRCLLTRFHSITRKIILGDRGLTDSIDTVVLSVHESHMLTATDANRSELFCMRDGILTLCHRQSASGGPEVQTGVPYVYS